VSPTIIHASRSAIRRVMYSASDCNVMIPGLFQNSISTFRLFESKSRREIVRKMWIWFSAILTSQIASPSASVDTQLHVCTSIMTQDVLTILTGSESSSLNIIKQNSSGLSVDVYQAELKTFRFVRPIYHRILKQHLNDDNDNRDTKSVEMIVPAFEKRQILGDILSFLAHLTTTIDETLNSSSRPISSNAFVVSAVIAARQMIGQISSRLSPQKEDKLLSEKDQIQFKRLLVYGTKLESTVAEQLEIMKTASVPMHFVLTRLMNESDVFFFQDRDSLNRVLSVCSERLVQSAEVKDNDDISGNFSDGEDEEDENDFDVRTLTRRDTSASSKTADDESEVITRECLNIIKNKNINVTCMCFMSSCVSNKRVHEEEIEYVRDAILKLHKSTNVLALETTNTFLAYFSGLCTSKPGSKACVETFQILLQVVDSGLSKLSSPSEFCRFLLALHKFCCDLPSPDTTSWDNDEEEKCWMQIETDMAKNVETWLIRIGSNTSSWYAVFVRARYLSLSSLFLSLSLSLSHTHSPTQVRKPRSKNMDACSHRVVPSR